MNKNWMGGRQCSGELANGSEALILLRSAISKSGGNGSLAPCPVVWQGKRGDSLPYADYEDGSLKKRSF